MDQLTTSIRSQQWLQMVQEQKASGLTIEARYRLLWKLREIGLG